MEFHYHAFCAPEKPFCCGNTEKGGERWWSSDWCLFGSLCGAAIPENLAPPLAWYRPLSSMRRACAFTPRGIFAVSHTHRMPFKNLLMGLFLMGCAVFQGLSKREDGPSRRIQGQGNGTLSSENGPLRRQNGPLWYHPAKEGGILNFWGIFYAIRWHNIFEIPPRWSVLCHPDAWHIRKIQRECRDCRTQNHTRKNRIFSPCPAPEAHWWQHLPHLRETHAPSLPISVLHITDWCLGQRKAQINIAKDAIWTSVKIAGRIAAPISSTTFASAMNFLRWLT